MPSELYEAAQEYVKRGWHIIPLKTGSKVPAVNSVPEYRERMPTNKELKNWFMLGNYNIAVLTGPASQLFVVDIDDQEKVSEYIEKYPTDLVSRTPRGGRHLFYHANGEAGDLTVTVGVLGEKVDTRGEGGYVVVPPSRVKYDDPNLKNCPPYIWQERGNPSELPNSIVKKLRKRRAQVIDTNIAVVQEDGRDLFVRVGRDGFTPGKHNIEVKDISRYLFRMGMDQAEVIRLLRQYNGYDATPLPDTELVKTIRSGISYEKSRKPKVDGKVDEPFRVVPGLEIVADYMDYDVEWLVDNWIPENSLLGIFAPPESFKTWVMIEAAVTVALGERSVPFLDSFPVLGEGKPVLIIQQEDFIGQVAQRVRTVSVSKSRNIDYVVEVSEDGLHITVPENPQTNIHVHPDSRLRFNDEQTMEGLERVIRDYGIKLVVIDPLYMLEPMDDKYFAGAAQGGMAELKRLRTKYECTFIIAHHTKKSGTGREGMFGSQLLNGAFEGVWQLHESAGTLSITKQGKFFKNREVYGIDFEIDTSPEGEKYEVILSDAEDGVLTGTYDQAILDVLNDHGPLGQTKIGEMVGTSSKTAGATLRRLETIDYVTKVGRKWSIPVDMKHF